MDTVYNRSILKKKSIKLPFYLSKNRHDKRGFFLVKFAYFAIIKYYIIRNKIMMFQYITLGVIGSVLAIIYGLSVWLEKDCERMERELKG